MKRIIVCIALTAAIFAGGTGCLFYTSSVSEKITENLTEVKRLYESGDAEGAAAAAERAGSDWRKFRELHVFSTDNDHILEITMSIARLENLIERESDELLTECSVAIELIEVYKSEIMPGIMNIL